MRSIDSGTSTSRAENVSSVVHIKSSSLSPVLLQLPAKNATNPAPYSPSNLKSCGGRGAMSAQMAHIKSNQERENVEMRRGRS